MKRFTKFALAAAALVFTSVTAQAEKPFISVASTTSTANSGLFDYILPKFTEENGIDVRVIAVGTGQALKLARNGDADVLFVHHRPSEEKFVADGYGKKRFDVMYNDFVLVGPKADPAGIKNCASPAAALAAIKEKNAPFASRGDDSGTHKREKSLWKSANITPEGESWYRATGSGMGATLNTASGMGAYALSDRGTWISFKNKADMEVLCEGDKSLFNPYGVIAVSKEKFDHIKEAEANKFVEWLTSAKGQGYIAEFKVQGQQLFTPNAQ